MNHDEISYNS